MLDRLPCRTPEPAPQVTLLYSFIHSTLLEQPDSDVGGEVRHTTGLRGDAIKEGRKVGHSAGVIQEGEHPAKGIPD